MRSRATALQPAIALVEEQMSTVALTPSISAVMQWSSPVQPGTECMVTCVMSGPVVASEVATATLTRRRKGYDRLLGAAGKDSRLFGIG